VPTWPLTAVHVFISRCQSPALTGVAVRRVPSRFVGAPALGFVGLQTLEVPLLARCSVGRQQECRNTSIKSSWYGASLRGAGVQLSGGWACSVVHAGVMILDMPAIGVTTHPGCHYFVPGRYPIISLRWHMSSADIWSRCGCDTRHTPRCECGPACFSLCRVQSVRVVTSLAQHLGSTRWWSVGAVTLLAPCNG
jgi:hypothetical protein